MAGTRKSGRRIDDATRGAMRADYLAGTWPGRGEGKPCTLDEVADRYGVGQRTVYAMAKAGGWAEARRMQENAVALPVLVAAQENQLLQIVRGQAQRMAAIQQRATEIALGAMGDFSQAMEAGAAGASPLEMAGVGVQFAKLAREFAPYHPELTEAANDGDITEQEAIDKLVAVLDRARARSGGGAAGED